MKVVHRLFYHLQTIPVAIPRSDEGGIPEFSLAPKKKADYLLALSLTEREEGYWFPRPILNNIIMLLLCLVHWTGSNLLERRARYVWNKICCHFHYRPSHGKLHVYQIKWNLTP